MEIITKARGKISVSDDRLITIPEGLLVLNSLKNMHL